jgi:hypothetical protein
MIVTESDPTTQVALHKDKLIQTGRVHFSDAGTCNGTGLTLQYKVRRQRLAVQQLR